MLTARTVARETISYEDVAEPVLEPGHALVRVHHVTLCGTDLHIWEDDYPTELPIVQGHEFSGVVEAIGNYNSGNTAGIRVGDRVAVSPMTYCGTCRPCLQGRFNVCRNISCIGCYSDGALVEVLSVPVEKLCPVPEGLALDLAAMAEPASIAMQAVNRGRPEAGETALVLGSGPIGLLATLYLTDLGVDVVCADTEPDRLSLARAFGAVDTLLVGPACFPDNEQSARLGRRTDGYGPGLVLEATGAPSSLEIAIRLVASAGRIVQVGISPRTATVSMKDIPFKELDLLGSRNSLNLIPDGLDLLTRHPDQARALMTHRFGFAELQQAYELMRNRTEKVGKIVIDMPAAGITGSAAGSAKAFAGALAPAGGRP
ncbi:alcohol dehydrogenase catalytic domain-containing protein [Arthrobacter sp. B10-11]|uniref:alcohol dehydrogenase catalytic domain-containing protein n=1 Tax=Arthrobacter sp. B10-11 TaxID=3081160 RepID=UPI002955D1F1|nr:alcohol dehydrogenase catalytic domain-containing protein [Arthrobacter sp. B10-11]MDV8149942.1 alcohol dehydrogenase catalytic domain-containing protein [Arthrobacter sp. B10-11]